jgi:hypothetical protein
MLHSGAWVRLCIYHRDEDATRNMPDSDGMKNETTGVSSTIWLRLVISAIQLSGGIQIDLGTMLVEAD